MADDGSPGDAVRIPSVMIPHDEGTTIFKICVQFSKEFWYFHTFRTSFCHATFKHCKYYFSMISIDLQN